MNLYLEKPLFLLVIPVGITLVWLLIRQRIRIGFSQLELLTGVRGVPLNLVQKLIFSLAIVLLGLALAQPARRVTTSTPVYVQARDIVISLDISGSMGSTFPYGGGSAAGKLATAKGVIEDFVAARPQDRIALVTFDTRAYLEWPLSVDHRAFLERLALIRTTGGTSIGQGLIAALAQLAFYGNQRGAVILVSDGISNVSPEEKSRIEFFLAEARPHLYWIVIGSQDELLTVQFRQYLEGLGGKVYLVDPEQLREVFNEISRLEASPVVYERTTTARVEFGPLLFVLAGVLVLVSLLEITKEV